MKTINESFEENYMAYEEPCDNKKGFRVRYAYVGPWFVYKMSKEDLARYKRLFAMLCALSTVCFGYAALYDCELNYNSFPTLFAGLSLAAFLFEWVGVVWFVAAKKKLTQQSYKQINAILKAAPLINAALLLGAFVSCVVLMIVRGYSLRLIFVPLLFLLASASSFLITFFYRAFRAERQENDTMDDTSIKFIRT